jgi:hypothetical protein
MSELSDPTIGLLIDIGCELFDAGGLTVLLLRCDLKPAIAETWGESLVTTLTAARNRANQGDRQARRSLFKLIRLMIEKGLTYSMDSSAIDRFEELREALLADGYQLSWERLSGGVHCQILPTDATPVPLAPEISALEAELDNFGYIDALNHYQQAVDSFINHNYEAANGQLRTTLEDLTLSLARQYAGYSGPKSGGQAINHMIEREYLPKADGGLLLQDIWKLAHTRGAHPGQSNPDEARFRMVIVTAIARFLLNYFFRE